MEPTELTRLRDYFGAVTRAVMPETRPASLLITHLLAERPTFIRAAGQVSDLRAVLPKPRSVHPAAREEVERDVRVDALTRELFSDPEAGLSYLESRAGGRELVLLDVGGYFAPILEDLVDRFSGRLLGVVEDTENGHQRYAAMDKLPCPVVSAARSPLKLPEDFLVGESVVFSMEALTRSRGDIFHGRGALVLGFGKLGYSIARLLHAKGVHVTVYDIDPVRRTHALSKGFTVAEDRTAALGAAGLVLCATGAMALHGDDFPRLRQGAYVATVTSSEDELDLASLPPCYETSGAGEHITRYRSPGGHLFYLLNDGNAVNFIHGASVGPFIYLVQGELLAGVRMLARGDLSPGMHEVPDADRATIADLWLRHYNR